MKSAVNRTREGGKFLSGVSLLTLSAVAVKVIGLAYRIPMLRVLGTAGMGYFNTAYEVYALLCVLSTAGLPVAMSVLLAGGDGAPAYRALSRRIYRVSLAVFCTIGVLGTAALLLPARLWAEMLGIRTRRRASGLCRPRCWRSAWQVRRVAISRGCRT